MMKSLATLLLVFISTCIGCTAEEQQFLDTLIASQVFTPKPKPSPSVAPSPSPTPSPSPSPTAKPTSSPMSIADVSPKCPSWEGNRSGVISLQGENINALKLILPWIWADSALKRQYIAAYEFGDNRHVIPFVELNNPESPGSHPDTRFTCHLDKKEHRPGCLRPHHATASCRAVAKALGSERPRITLRNPANDEILCTLELQKGKSICERND